MNTSQSAPPVRMVLTMSGGNDPKQTEIAIEWRSVDPPDVTPDVLALAQQELRRRRETPPG